MKTSKLCFGAKRISVRHGKQLFRCLPLIGMLFATSHVSAADNPEVKFNSSVRYSQWAINSRLYDFKANTKVFGFAKYEGDTKKADRNKSDIDALNYVPGIVAKATIETADYYKDFDWSKPWFLSIKEYGDAYYTNVPTDGKSFDDLNAAKLYIGVYNNSNATESDQSNVNTALSRVKAGLQTANNSYVIPSGTLAETAGNVVAGGWWHKNIYENQMWLDGAYMGSALLAQLTQFYGTNDNVFGSKTADWDMVFKQMNIVWNMCWNSNDKLMYHAFDATATAKAKNGNSNTWAGLSSTTPYVFHSAAYWGRANAWYLMALVDVLEAMKADGQGDTDNYNTLKSHLEELARGIADCQDNTTGGWYQLLDKDGSFVSTKYNGLSKNDVNYIETSATSLFSAALFKAVRLNLLDNSYKAVAQNAFEGLIKNFVTLDSNGGIQIWGSCKSAGLGGSKYRDGSNEYYLSGEDVPMVKKGETTEGKVLGGFIMAATEYERACQNQNSKQILYAKDLAPKYTISSSADVLDATAYGTGAESAKYQWYKDDAAVTNATSATYSPTESGVYYCTATANGTTITTGTTTVTVNSSTDGEDNPTTSTTLFEYTFPTSGTGTDTKVGNYGNITYSSIDFGTNGCDLKDNKRYVQVALTNNTIKEGDIITVKTYSTSSETSGIIAKNESNAATTICSVQSAENTVTSTYTVKANDAIVGSSVLKLFRNTKITALAYIKITRSGSTDTPTTKKYTVTAIAGEGGKVAITNGSSETVASGKEVEENTSLTFTATPNDGYEFVNWTDASNNVVSTENPYTTTVSADINITANFKQKETTGGETTTTTGTFSLEDLKTLDSTPSETEKSEITLNNGYVTVKAGYKINANTGGIKMSKSDQCTFSIVANNGAKVKSITIEQDRSDIKLNYNPAGTESAVEGKTNTFKYDYSNSKPSEITVSYNTGNNIYVKSVIVEYEYTSSTPKTDLTASFSPSTVDATEGDTSVNLPTLSVKANDADFTAYSVGEYTSTDENVAKVENGKIVFGKAGNATISTTITPTDATLYNGCDVEFTVNVKKKTVNPVDPTQKTVIYDFNSTVGTTTSYASSVSYDTGNTKITFGSDFRIKEKKYITITPKDGSDGFKAGDVITLKGYCDSKNPSGIVIYNSIADGAESIFKTNALAKSTANGSEYTFTLTEDCANLYFGRFGGGNTYLTSLNVTRPASSVDKVRLTASFTEKTKVVVNTTTTVNLPALTVKAGDTALTNEQYNVKYASNAEDVATISGNIITVKGEGTATITATITPVNEDSYEGTTATFQLTVKQPTQLNITVQDVTMNVTDAKEKQPTINVYGDDDKLLKLGIDYTLSFSVKEGTNVTVDNAGTFKPTGSSYKWTEGTTTFTVKATPIPSSLGDTYAEGTVDFTYNVIQGKLTPHFLEVFSGRNIKFYPDGKQRKITVPLIYDYEDVSDYFDYIYTIDGTPITKDTKGDTKLGVAKNDEAHTLIYTTPTTAGTHTVVVSATPNTGSKDDGSDDYSNVYDTPATLSFTITVDSKYKRITVDLDPKEIDLTTGTSDGAPDVTVTYTDDKTVVPESEYVISWTTNNESYARVNASTGHIEAVSEGQTKGRCLVTGDNIESTTAFFNINVDDPAKYRVKSTGTYKNETVMWNQDRTMAVTLGGWMFPNNIEKTIFSSEGLRNTYVWGGDKSTSAKATWAINGEQYIVSGDKQKNARQENGANALPESTTIYSADFETTTQSIKDPMFGVPCSGSYLVFNPTTSGVVSVDILQNGVFDKDTQNKKTVYQYRPQRRVFVMDESGNFVKSEAVIGNANGKPLGKGNDRFTLSNYTWDITGQAPTLGLVNSHFNGLDDFEMSETGFKNNVYTSTLPQEIIPNQAAKNHENEEGMESANGWSVLADGPVTYSFRVLPGKTYYLYNFGSKIGFYGFTFKEDETKPVVDNIEYDETATDNNVTSTAGGHVATVKLNRTFKAGVWSTCVLPFSLNKAQVDAIFGETYSSTATEGTEIIYFDRVENDKVWFVRHAYNTIVANKPFLIKPAKDVSEINTANITDYPYVIIEAPDNNKPADWCEGNGYKWVSGYNNNEMYVSKGDGFIATDGSFMNYTGSDAPLKGFRGYLKANLASGATPKMLSVGVGSNVEEDGNTTIVDRLFIDSDADTAQGIGDGKVYNINGQVVGNDREVLNTLPSGVYIINGKKYIK